MSHQQRIDPDEVELQMRAFVEVIGHKSEQWGHIYHRKLPSDEADITPRNIFVYAPDKRFLVQPKRHDQGFEILVRR